jgi:hypothetical protein
MATNKILNIPQWLLVGSSSQPDLGYSSIYPKLGGPTGSWYVVDDQNNEKRLAFDYVIGAGISQSEVGNPSPYGYRLDIQLGGGLTYSQGFYSGAPISVFGITPSMLSITGSNGPGYVLSTSTVSGEFKWIQSSSTINGPTNAIPKFTGDGFLTASQIIDTGTLVYIGTTPSSTYASFSVNGSMNVGNASDGYLYFGDQINNYIKGELGGGFVVRTTDEFKVELYTNSVTTYKVIDFDNLGDENRTLGLMDGVFQFGDFTYGKYLSASNLNLVHFGKTQSAFQLELISGSQGAIKIQDGGQGSYSLLVSDSSGVGTWQKFYGYNGLTTSGLGIGLNLTNIQGLTLSGGTFGIDYTKFAAPISVSDTFTVSIATVSVVTGVTYGSVFETPVIRVDQFGRITTIGTVSTSAFTGPQGPTGFSFTWQGTYATSSTYSQYNVIEYDGSSYISLGTSSPGLTPSTVTQSWNLMASKGATGAVGSTGQGFTWQGTFSESITYGFYDVAYYNGSSYISVTISNLGNTPSNATQSWNIMALGSNTETLNITGTYGAVLVYGEFGWTALGPATAGYVLTTGGTSSLPYWSEPIAGSGSGFGTFSRNFDVVLNDGKSFGKYLDGQTIYSIGMTLEDFIYDVVTETKAPTINLTAVPPVIEFGATGDSITLNFGYTITNAGATAISGELKYSIDDKATYITLFTGTATPNVLVHTISFPEYTAPRYDYKYTVEDSVGGSASAEDFVTVAQYVSPTVTTTVTGQSLNQNGVTGETHLKRQYGNVASDVTLTYERNSPRIDVETYSLFFRNTPSGLYTKIYGPLAVGDPNTGTENDDHSTIVPTSNPSLAQTTNNIDYYHQVDDEYDTINSTRERVTFEPLYFYGPTSSTPTDKSQLLTLPNVKLSSAAGTNEFTFFSGTTYDKYIVAIPANKTLSEAKDMTQTGNPILTSSFILQSPEVSVLDFGDNNAYNYKVYAYTPTIGYTIDVAIRIKLT